MIHDRQLSVLQCDIIDHREYFGNVGIENHEVTLDSRLRGEPAKRRNSKERTNGDCVAMRDIERLRRKLHAARSPIIAREIHPTHQPGILFASKDVSIEQVFFEMQGGHKSKLAARVHFATGEVQPVVIGWYLADVSLA